MEKIFESFASRHLQQLTYSNYTIYVIDNTSSDNSLIYCKENFPSVHFIKLTNNYGFAGGYNQGLANIEAEYILMMNSDVEVPSSFLEPLLATMESDDTIAIVQPKLLDQRNPHMFEHAGAAGGMIDFLGYPFCRGRIFDTVEPDNQQYNEPAEIFWASGACCLVRTAAYRQVGGMYEYFFMHSEEIDLCWRLQIHHWRIVYCPAAHIFHLGGGSLSYQSPRKTYLNFRNNMVMCLRNSPWYYNLWLFPTRLVLDIAAAVQYLLKSDAQNCLAVLKAYRDIVKWMIIGTNSPTQKRSLLSLPAVFKKSIVWQYFVQGKKYFRR